MSRRPQTHITIEHSGQSGASTSRSGSFSEEEELSRQDSQEYSTGDQHWDDYDELDPSDSASASNQRPGFRRAGRAPSRRHKLPHRGHPFRPAPNAPVSVDPSEDYPPFGARGYGPPPPGFYGGRGQGHGGYPQSNVGGYMGGPGYHGTQMVPYQQYSSNPFTPISSGSGASYFGEPRGPHYDMMPYGNQGHYGGYGGHGPYGHGPQYLYNGPPPPPPATEHPGASTTPGLKEPPASKEVLEMKERLAKYEAEVAAKAEVEKRKELEERIRKDAEDTIQRRLEEMRRTQEEAKKEIEKARVEAEEAARKKLEAEKKAEEERAKLHAAAVARAEREARDKVEAEHRAAEEAKKREEEARAAAEAAARAKFDAELKAQAEAKVAADKAAAEAAEQKKKWEEDAKLTAELEARKKLAEENKKADEAKAAEEEKKKADKALKEKAVEEHKAKMEAEAKKAKAPIKFKDAVGRKFSFPFHLCATWQGMEELIKQAFLNIDMVSRHVQDGHYDLIGPNGEIILPSVWEKVIEPDWAITMQLWPIEKREQHMPGLPFMPPGIGRHHGHGPAGHHGRMPGGVPPAGRRPGGNPPPPPGWHGGVPPAGPGGGRRPIDPRMGGMDPRIERMERFPDVDILTVEKGRDRGKKPQGSVLSWMAGGKPGKSSKNRKK